MKSTFDPNKKIIKAALCSLKTLYGKLQRGGSGFDMALTEGPRFYGPVASHNTIPAPPVKKSSKLDMRIGTSFALLFTAFSSSLFLLFIFLFAHREEEALCVFWWAARRARSSCDFSPRGVSLLCVSRTSELRGLVHGEKRMRSFLYWFKIIWKKLIFYLI